MSKKRFVEIPPPPPPPIDDDWFSPPTTIDVERSGIGWWLYPSDRQVAWFVIGTRARAERVARRKLRRIARYDARETFTVEQP